MVWIATLLSAPSLVIILIVVICFISLVSFRTHVSRLSFRVHAPPEDVTTVMPLGDSITYGEGSADSGGYRTHLWNKFMNSGYKVKFVGSLSSGPCGIGTHNEGHPGSRIDQLSTHVVRWLTKYRPQVILLLIGTNDIVQAHDVKNAPHRLNFLIDQITSTLPNSTLVVASIPSLDNMKLYARGFCSSVDFGENVMSYNTAIPGIVQSKVTQGKYVYYVDMYDAIPVCDVEDGIHPNDVGYASMANVWYFALVKLFASAKM